jgi:hypothetical protein
MSRWVFLYVAAAALIGGASDEQTAQMRRDVLSMVRAADAPSRSLMPWAGPVEEVERVARHGKAVVPLMIVLLPEDPDDPDPFYDHWSEQDIMAGRQFDWACGTTGGDSAVQDLSASRGRRRLSSVRQSSLSRDQQTREGSGSRRSPRTREPPNPRTRTPNSEPERRTANPEPRTPNPRTLEP